MKATNEPTIVEVAVTDRPQLSAFLFCDWVNITKDDKQNLIGVFDSITLPAGEIQTPVFTLFIKIAFIANGAYYLRVLGPDNVTVFEEPITALDTLPDSEQLHHVEVIEQLQFEPKLAGVYRFEMLYREQSLGWADLSITFAPSEEQQINGREEQARRVKVGRALAMFSPDEEPFVLRRTGEWRRNLGMLAKDPVAQEIFEAVRQHSDSDDLP